MPQRIEQTGAQKSWEEGCNNAKAQNFARVLMETPANLMTPIMFCEQVTEMLEPLGVKCTSYGPDFLKSTVSHFKF